MHRGSLRGRLRRRGRGATLGTFGSARSTGETVPSAATRDVDQDHRRRRRDHAPQPTSFGPSKVATTWPPVLDPPKAVRRASLG